MLMEILAVVSVLITIVGSSVGAALWVSRENHRNAMASTTATAQLSQEVSRLASSNFSLDSSVKDLRRSVDKLDDKHDQTALEVARLATRVHVLEGKDSG